MARTYRQKNRKEGRTCPKCNKVIAKGEEYLWAKPRYRGKVVRCTSCGIGIGDTSSSKMVPIWEAQQDFSLDGCTSLEDVTSQCEDLAGTIREVAEEYRESAQNIEDGFQHPTSMSEELGEKADELEGWADEVEQAASSCEEFDEEAAMESAKADKENKDQDDFDAAVEAAREAWLEGVIDEVQSAVDNCPV